MSSQKPSSDTRRFIQDSTFQLRGTSPDRVRATDSPLSPKVRQLYAAGDYRALIDIFAVHPLDFHACLYAAAAMRVVGELRASIRPALTAVAVAPDDYNRSAALNQLGTLFDHVFHDLDVADHLYSVAWALHPHGQDHGWRPMINRCELWIRKARTANQGMDEAVKRVDEAIGELLANFADWESNDDFVSYMHRQVDISEWRESPRSNWSEWFGNTRPR